VLGVGVVQFWFCGVRPGELRERRVKPSRRARGERNAARCGNRDRGSRRADGDGLREWLRNADGEPGRGGADLGSLPGHAGAGANRRDAHGGAQPDGR
jgi:hypothetical protein